MSYYRFNRGKVLKNASNKYHNKGEKENAAKCYAVNQEVLDKMQEISIKTCYGRKRIKKEI